MSRRTGADVISASSEEEEEDSFVDAEDMQIEQRRKAESLQASRKGEQVAQTNHKAGEEDEGEEDGEDGFKKVCDPDLGLSLWAIDSPEAFLYLRAEDGIELKVNLAIAQECHHLSKMLHLRRQEEDATKKSLAEEPMRVEVAGETLRLIVRYVNQVIESRKLGALPSSSSSSSSSSLTRGGGGGGGQQSMTASQRRNAWREEFWRENIAFVFKMILAAEELQIPELLKDAKGEIQRRIRSGKTTEDICAAFGITMQVDKMDTVSGHASGESDAGSEGEDGAIEDDFAVVNERPHVNINTTACTDCKTPFGAILAGFVPKHHCRLCMRAFCGNCSNHYRVLSVSERQTAEALLGISSVTQAKNFITNVVTGRSSNAVRVCRKCVLQYSECSDGLELKNIFDAAELTVTDVAKVKDIAPAWLSAHALYMRDLGRILMLAPTHTYTEKEKNMLWRNRMLLSGHSVWMTHLCLAQQFGNEDEIAQLTALINTAERVVPCETLGCQDYACSKTLTPEDAFVLLTSLTPVRLREVRDLAVSALSSVTVEALDSFLPALVVALCDEVDPGASPLFRLLLTVVEKSEHLTHELYWELTSKCTEGVHAGMYRRLRDRFLLHVGKTCPEYGEDLCGVQELLDVIQRGEAGNAVGVSGSIRRAMAQGFLSPDKPTIPLPVCVSKRVCGVSLDDIRTFNSNTPPLVIRFFTEDAQAESAQEDTAAASAAAEAAASARKARKVAFVDGTPPVARRPVSIPSKNMGYKRDDIRKDRVAQAMIRFVEHVLNEAGCDVKLQTYRVVCTSPRSGFMEWIDNASTVSSIGDVKDYVYLKDNINKVTSEVQQRLMSTLAAYSIISLLLGLGDRHTENIMITTEGRFFHIDYGFMFGEDPKPFLRQNVSLHKEVIKAIGTSFLHPCLNLMVNYYNILRKHASSLICIVLPLAKTDPPSVTLTPERLEQGFVERFCLGRTDADAEMILRRWLVEDVESMKPEVTDAFHEARKIPQAVYEVGSKVVGTVSSGAAAVGTLFGYAYSRFVKADGVDSKAEGKAKKG